MNERLARWAVTRVGVLVVEVPGWGRARCAVEADLRRRGWFAALSPADADALVVCGRPGPRLKAAVDLVWDQLPGPRARATVPTASAAATALDGVVAQLADDGRQRQDAAARSPGSAMGMPMEGHARSVRDDPNQDSADAGGGQAESDGDRGHMDDGDMEMPMPGGIPLAGGVDDDRDGLEMDVLHVPLGPVLPAWPAGLLLRCTVSGDVVIGAEAEVLEAADPAPAGEGLVQGSPPERLDRAARLLTLAGWGDAATAAARLRDEFLDTVEPAALLPALDRLTRRVARSRLLRWSISVRGRFPQVDAYQRLLMVLRDARAALAGTPTPLAPIAPGDLPGLVVGRQLAAVRLLVAAAELDTAALSGAGAGLR